MTNTNEPAQGSTFQKPLSRRSVLGAGLAAAGGLSLAGCGSVSAGLAGSRTQPNSLTYWNLFTGGDGARMVALEQGYQKSHPNITLNSNTFTWGNPYYTKLALATLGKKPPDVAISHLTRARIMAKANLLEPFTEAEMARHGMTPDKFSPKPIQAATVDGKLYAVPLDVHPFVLFYNTKICKKAGLLGSDGKLIDLSGPTAFKEALAKAKKVTGKYGGVLSVNADPSSGFRYFYTLYSQLGGQILNNNGKGIVIDEGKAMQVLSYMEDISVKQQLMPSNIDYGTAIVAFSQGQAGFFIQGEWEVTTFVTSKTPFSMTNFPNVFGGSNHYAVQADSHTFVIPKQASPSPARREAALGFIRSLLDQSQTWAEGGHVPTWLPVQQSAAYKALKPQSDYAKSADYVTFDPDAWYSGSGSDFETAVGSQVSAVESGQSKPKDAIAAMKAGLAKFSTMPSPIV